MGARSGLRVLQLAPLYSNHVRQWAERADALGCRVSVAGHVRPGRQLVEVSDLAEHVEVAPESVADAPMSAQLTWLRGVLERVRPDVIQAHWLQRWCYLATVATEQRVVVTPWGCDLYRARGVELQRADHALSASDAVLALSPHMARDVLARGVPADRIHPVDLGVDLQRFRPASPAERARVRDELGLHPGPLVLSGRAGVEPYNLDVVIAAFGILRRHVPDATLVLAHGDAPVSPPVAAALREVGPENGVRALGRVPHADMARYLRAATAAISIPTSDGSPNFVWEALASGVPTVVSDLPQLAERLAGSAGVRLVAPRAEPAAAALRELASRSEPHGPAARAARAWAEVNVDQRPNLARLGEVYAAVERRHPPRRAKRSVPTRSPAALPARNAASQRERAPAARVQGAARLRP
jgi:glycosyltransferase involved in cell wall biosynthesis